MRKFTTKAFAIMMTAALVLGTAACGSSSATETTTESAAEGTTSTLVQIANPVQEVGEAEMVEQTGISLPAPEGATDVRYSIIDMGDDPVIAQMDFTLDGKKYYLRAQSSELLTLNTEADNKADFDYNQGNISGLYYDWVESGTTSVQSREAIFNISQEGAGYIAWLDATPGILYNLCMEENADYDTLEPLAEKIFVPLQSDFAPEEATESE